MAMISGLESFGNSLLAPITDAFPEPTSAPVVTPVTPAEQSTAAASPKTSHAPRPQSTPESVATSVASAPTQTAASVTPIDQTSIGSVITGPATTDSQVSTSIDSDTSSSSTKTPSHTTFATSTRNDPSTSTPLAPTASTDVSSASNQASPSSNGSGNSVSPAGIAIAVIAAVVLVGTIIYLVFRFCKPVRSWWESWRKKGHEDRTYREAIDGPRGSDDFMTEKDFLPFGQDKAAARKSLLARVRQSRAMGEPSMGLGLGPVSPIREHPDFNNTPRSSQTSLLPSTEQVLLQQNRSSIQKTPPLSLPQKDQYLRQKMASRPERISQIGLAVSSPSETPRSADRQNFGNTVPRKPLPKNARLQ